MSVPLVWTMHNQHHVTAPTALGIPAEFFMGITNGDGHRWLASCFSTL